MYRTIRTIAALALVTLAATTVSAQLLNQPTRGKSFKTNIMVAYEECTTPDTVTSTHNLLACSSPVMVDPTCGFAQARGAAKLQMKAGNIGNIAIRVRFNKLAPGCQGNVINFEVRVRRSGPYCSGALGNPGNCTMSDFTQQVTSCVVTNGKCKASEQFFLGGGAEPGQIELRDVIITNLSHEGKRSFRIGTINGKIVR